MKKPSTLRIAGFAMGFAAIIFLVVLIFLNQIKSEIMQVISSYGYPAIFLMTLILETLAQPIGPEVPLLSGKLMGLNMIYMTSIVIAVSVTANFINYGIGKFFYNRFISHKYYKKHLATYKKKGKYALLVAALSPVPYVPFCWFSGAFGLSIRNFLCFGVVPRIVRILLVSYALHLFL